MVDFRDNVRLAEVNPPERLVETTIVDEVFVDSALDERPILENEQLVGISHR